MEKWMHKGYSPEGGKIYHKNDRIMIIYPGRIKMFCDINKDKEMLPCNAIYKIGRNKNGRVINCH